MIASVLELRVRCSIRKWVVVLTIFSTSCTTPGDNITNSMLVSLGPLTANEEWSSIAMPNVTDPILNSWETRALEKGLTKQPDYDTIVMLGKK